MKNTRDTITALAHSTIFKIEDAQKAMLHTNHTDFSKVRYVCYLDECKRRIYIALHNLEKKGTINQLLNRIIEAEAALD